MPNRIERREGLPFQSIDRTVQFAWLIGALSAAGSVSATHKRIRLETDNLANAAYFFHIGNSVLSAEHGHESRIEKRDSNKYSVYFNTEQDTANLGDFTRKDWADTIEMRHQWIFTELDYQIAFLSGYFALNGHAQDPAKNTIVALSVGSNSGAKLLKKILQNLGINDPIEHKSNNQIRAILLGNASNTRTFASIISVPNPKSETLLAKYQGMTQTLRVPDYVTAAFAKVQELHAKQPQLGKRTLHKHPDFLDFKDSITEAQVNYWLHGGTANHNKYKTRQFAPVDRDPQAIRYNQLVHVYRLYFGLTHELSEIEDNLIRTFVDSSYPSKVLVQTTLKLASAEEFNISERIVKLDLYHYLRNEPHAYRDDPQRIMAALFPHSNYK